MSRSCSSGQRAHGWRLDRDDGRRRDEDRPGVDTGHPDLQAKIVTPYDATDGDNDQEPNPGDGHGTACAGIAAAVTNNSKGVAGLGWNVKILPVRIAYSNGGDWITSYAIIEDGIRTAVDRGAHVLSNSWGGGFSNFVNSAIDYAMTTESWPAHSARTCACLVSPTPRTI